MNIQTEAKITLTAEDEATAIVRKLRIEVDRLNKSLTNLTKINHPAFQTSANPVTASKATDALTTKSEAAAMAALRKRWTFESRMNRQRASEAQGEERRRRAYDSAAMADIKRRMAFVGRMARQQVAELRAVERERERAANAAERDAASALRRQISGDRWRFALRERMDRKERQDRQRDRREIVGRGQDAYRNGRDAIRDTTRPVGIAALAGSATATAATRKILGSEAAVDAAEINTRSYGGLSQEAARTLRDGWAAPVAETLGAEASKLLTAWTDAVKLGIPAGGAKGFAELATKTAEAWSVPFEAVTDIMGTVNTILTSKGDAFNLDRLKSVANTVQHLAAKQSTTPEKLLEFMRQGAGAAQLLNMSQEAALAFGSASTSLGNRPGESGRMMDYVAGRVIELPRLTKKKGDEGKQARNLVRDLGYGSAEQMERGRRANPDEFLPDLLSRFNKITNPNKQDQAIRFFTGREWLGEFGRMVKGIDTYKEAVKLSKEAKGLDAISGVWNLHRLKLAFVSKQFRAGWFNILGEFGKILSPLARQAGDHFLEWTAKLRNGGLQARFKAVLDGLLEGLSFKSFPALLEGIFGKPGEGSAGAIESWRAAARGFGQGLRDAGDAIRAFFSAFTGGSSDPEAIGRWTGRILAFGAAMVIASPAITVLSGLTSGILALGAAATTALAAFKIAGLVGAGSATAGAAGAAAGAGGLAAILGATVLPVSLVAISAGVVAALWGREALKGSFLGIPSGNGGEPRTPEGDLGAELGAIAPRLRREADPPARVEKQSFGGYNGAFDQRGLIHKAGIVTADIVNGFDRLGRTLSDRLGAKVQSAALSTSSTAALSAFAGSTGPDTSRTVIPGFPQAGVQADGGPRVPGWFGRGGGNGVVAPTFRGNQKAIAKTAFDFFRAKGLSAEATSGILANMDAESSFNPAARGDGGKAHGLFQHHADRRAAILRGAGIDMSTASPEKQLEGAWWEMNHGDAGAQRALRILKSPGISARDAGAAFVQHFERPAKDERAIRGSMAEGFNREFGTGGIPPADNASAAAMAGGVHPLDGKGRFTSDFGIRRHPITGALKMHNGVDLAAPAGTVVKAMKAGIASLDRSGDVSLKHEDGTSTTYRHIVAGIEAGAKVAAGQAIGRLRANDPRSTGPHLHLEARGADGRLVDPKGMLAAKPQSMEGFKSSGWKKAEPASTAVPQDDASDIVRPGQGFRASAPATPESLAAKVPMPAPRGRGAGGDAPGIEQGGAGPKSGSSGGGNTVTVHNVIHAGQQNPQELAGHIQRHITEAWNYRSHDLEPELT